MALNNDKYPKKCDFEPHHLSNLNWKRPSDEYERFLLSKFDDIPKHVMIVQPRHRRMMRLFAQISSLLFPYWAYNTKHHGIGLIVVTGQRFYDLLDCFVD